MKRLLAVFISCWSLSAGAYTIDFEEFAPGTAGPVTSGGYVISGSCSLSGCLQNDVAAGNAYRVVAAADLFNDVIASITVSRSDGGAFSLLTLDTINPVSTFIYGETAGGASISGQVGDLGQGDWLAIVSFSVEGWVPTGVGIPAVAEIDNIVVTAVPVPAALWLFVSGLLGLGFLRRQSAEA